MEAEFTNETSDTKPATTNAGLSFEDSAAVVSSSVTTADVECPRLRLCEVGAFRFGARGGS